MENGPNLPTGPSELSYPFWLRFLGGLPTLPLRVLSSSTDRIRAAHFTLNSRPVSTGISLLELQTFMRRVVALNFGDPLWVRAEISQVNESRGHHYFTFVEKTDAGVVARASGMLWAKTFRRLTRQLGQGLTTLLQDGREVLVQVEPKYSEVYGFSLHIVDIDPTFTLGKLELERQQTIADLSARGLLERNRMLPLPPVLQRLAVVSSATAAGLRDYQHELRHNPYGYAFDNQLFAAAMQGDRCPVEVPAALQQIKKLRRHFDAVLLLRGGGSRLDLAAFDDRRIGAAIARCPLPVLTGLGHEQDTSVADLCAHAALKTPTALGRFLLEHNHRFEQQTLLLARRVERTAQHRFREEAQHLDQLNLTLRYAARQQVVQHGQHLERTAQRLRTAVEQRLHHERTQLDWQRRLLDFADPQRVLTRGYALVRQDGNIVSAAADLDATQPVRLEFRDGTVELKNRA